MSAFLGLLLASGTAGISRVGISPVVTVSATSITLAKPSGVSAGNLLVAIMANITGATYTGDTGWTEIADLGGSLGLRIAYRVADGSEGSSFTFTSTSSTHRGVIIAYSGAVFDVAGSFDTSSAGGDVDAPSVTLSADGLLLAIYAGQLLGQDFTTPTDMLEEISDGTVSGPGIAIFSQQRASGASGIKTSTPSGGGSTAGILIGLRSE